MLVLQEIEYLVSFLPQCENYGILLSQEKIFREINSLVHELLQFLLKTVRANFHNCHTLLSHNFIRFVCIFDSCYFTNFSITGGIRVVDIKKSSNELVFREPSRSSESVRPYFLIDGKERQVQLIVYRKMQLLVILSMLIFYYQILTKCKKNFYFSVENLRPICEKIDEDLEKIKFLIVEYQGTRINVNVKMIPAWDGKLIRT